MNLDEIMTPIEIKNLIFTYNSKNSDPVLNISELIIQSGEKIFLHGPSGSGKSTLLELLAGVITPSSGKISLLEKDITLMSPQQRDAFRADHIGYIFQSFNLIPYLSTLENITLPLYLSSLKRKKINSQDEMSATQHLLEELGIKDFANKKVSELSVGQQQRVAVARALMGEPEIILADEPTSALDYDHREKFIKLLFQVANRHKTTIIFVSHDQTLKNIFDRSISLDEINLAGRK
ncbi:MAG: ABC transporter ATP-binding protein [Bdellovibrionales bacterium]|nr:ABC transporter ATP-binding protein [Bdellovibrionales bacterium]